MPDTWLHPHAKSSIASESEQTMTKKLTCAFCTKPQADVRKMVQGMTGSVICDECIVASVAVMLSVDVSVPSSDAHQILLRKQTKPPEDPAEPEPGSSQKPSQD